MLDCRILIIMVIAYTLPYPTYCGYYGTAVFSAQHTIRYYFQSPPPLLLMYSHITYTSSKGHELD